MIKFLRTLPHFKGKFRLVRFLFRKKLKGSKNEIIKGKYEIQYYLPNLKENIAFEIFANGIYESDTSALIAEKLPIGGVLLDIGVNIGSIAIPVCTLRKDVKVICVEASTIVFAFLKKNIELNKLTNCILINKAISNSNDANITFFNPDELFGKGSMTSSFKGDSETVKTITVDTLLSKLEIEQINFIKIDIEGYEYFAFQGAEKLLQQPDAPDILFEFLDSAETPDKNLNPGDAQNLLLSYGYRIYKTTKCNSLNLLKDALLKGEAMLFATKKDVR